MTVSLARKLISVACFGATLYPMSNQMPGQSRSGNVALAALGRAFTLLDLPTVICSVAFNDPYLAKQHRLLRSLSDYTLKMIVMCSLRVLLRPTTKPPESLKERVRAEAVRLFTVFSIASTVAHVVCLVTFNYATPLFYPEDPDFDPKDMFGQLRPAGCPLE